jgi:hypothetical protein
MHGHQEVGGALCVGGVRVHAIWFDQAPEELTKELNECNREVFNLQALVEQLEDELEAARKHLDVTSIPEFVA